MSEDADTIDQREAPARLEKSAAIFADVRARLSEVIFGQDAVIEQTLVTLLAGGHGLLIGVPGANRAMLWLNDGANALHAATMIGTQFVFVFVVTMVQGFTPPESIMPGVDRFAGIVGGLAILMIVSLLLWPSDEEIKTGQTT